MDSLQRPEKTKSEGYKMITSDKYYEGFKDIQNNFNMTRLFSFGGGVQSTAVMVLQMLGKLLTPYDAFIFSNVGDDSESPATIEYMKKYTRPFAAKHGIELIEVHKTTYKKKETLLEYIHRTPKSIPIPCYMAGGAPGHRSCTQDFKIRVVDKWVRENNYSHAVIGLGISIDEFSRMRGENWHNKYGKKNLGYWKKRQHPLIDLRLSRMDCISIIQSVGLPIPPKSACWFCPFTSRSEWIDRKRNEPMLFEQAIQLEQHINIKRVSIGRDEVYLHPQTRGKMNLLNEAVPNQLGLFDSLDESPCDSGYCFT